jgi:hypothetical protein
MGWINSDDLLLPGSLAAIGEFFAKYPEVEWVTGQPSALHEDGTWKLHKPGNWSRLRFLSGNYRWVQQESTFWRRSLWERAGGYLSTDVDIAVDLELWIRFFRHAELYTYEMPLGTFRYREGQRSSAFSERYEAEALSLIRKESEHLDREYRRIFQAILPETIQPMDSAEAESRHRHLAICDPPVITPDQVQQRTERRSAGSSTSPPRHDSSEYLLRPDSLEHFKNIHSGERCFIMGNGPSLNKMDLNKLEGETVFGCNNIFLLFDKIAWRPTYYACVDSRVLPDRADDIDRMLMETPSITAFFPAEIVEHAEENRFPTRTIIPPMEGRYYFRERANSLNNLPYSMFSIDVDDHIVQPYTVVITLIQIAAYMGFSEIYLIGCDTNYSVPEDALKEGTTADGRHGLALTSTSDNDSNHFDPTYFGAGRKWHDPQTDKMIMQHGYAREACELLGADVYNATVGGMLEVYLRRDFDSLFDSKSAAGQIAKPRPRPRKATPAAPLPPGYSAEVDVSPGKKWYSGPAHKLQAVSPSLFNFLKAIRRTAVRALKHPRWLLAAALGLGLVVWLAVKS